MSLGGALTMGTYGPAYDGNRDRARLHKQHEGIRDWMLTHGGWRTLIEIREALGYPESSISAQLRHLRKRQFGSYCVEKRRRHGAGTWEYRVSRPSARLGSELAQKPDFSEAPNSLILRHGENAF
jgi:hypothetical protein